MKQFEPDFTDHISAEVTTLCNCWAIELVNNQIMGFTDHDKDIEFSGAVYEAASGFETSEIEDSLGISTDEQELVGALQSDKITSDDIHARIYDGAIVKHFVVNWSKPTEHALMRTLVIGEITQADSLFKASVKSQTSLLDQTNNRRFQKLCSAKLGDDKCNVALENDFKVVGTVEKAFNSQLIEVSGLSSYLGGWFRSGEIHFTSGNNTGVKVEIAEHKAAVDGTVNSALNLWASLPQNIEVGDTFEITPGCDKQFSTCKAKFLNGENFRGFPHMPDAEFAMSYASVSKKMDGGPIFNDEN